VIVEYVHASRYGNGAAVAEEFRAVMVAKGVTVNVHHIRDVRPDRLPPADLYAFSSPGRLGKPIGDMRRFLTKVRLAAGTRYVVVATELAPQPNKQTGALPSAEEQARWQRVLPVMSEVLTAKGLTKVAEAKIQVTGMRGPLEVGWRDRVADLAAAIPVDPHAP
jgi:sulfite reductase alpha subunit-like flavoprotein